MKVTKIVQCIYYVLLFLPQWLIHSSGNFTRPIIHFNHTLNLWWGGGLYKKKIYTHNPPTPHKNPTDINRRGVTLYFKPSSLSTNNCENSIFDNQPYWKAPVPNQLTHNQQPHIYKTEVFILIHLVHLHTYLCITQ